MENEKNKISYVSGWPKDAPISSDYFNSLKIVDGKPEKGEVCRNSSIWSYEGPLKGKDFEIFYEIFNSDQFKEYGSNQNKFLEKLAISSEKGTEHFTKTIYESKMIYPPSEKVKRKDFFGKLLGKYEFIQHEPYAEKIKTIKKIPKTSKTLLGELENLIKKHGVPNSVYVADKLLFDEAKRKGEYFLFSEYIELGLSNKNIVLLDGEPRGTVEFVDNKKKKNSYRGAYSSEYHPMDIKINIDGRETIIEKDNMWCCSQNNVILWELDDIIRSRFLGGYSPHKFIYGC